MGTVWQICKQQKQHLEWCLVRREPPLAPFSPCVCSVQPRVLMRWWMRARRVMEALDPPVTAPFRGDSSKLGPHLHPPWKSRAGVQWRWMAVIISSTCSHPSMWLHAAPGLLICLHEKQMFKRNFFLVPSRLKCDYLTLYWCSRAAEIICAIERLVLLTGTEWSNHKAFSTDTAPLLALLLSTGPLLLPFQLALLEMSVISPAKAAEYWPLVEQLGAGWQFHFFFRATFRHFHSFSQRLKLWTLQIH